MKLYNSIHEKNKKKELVFKNGKIRFNNKKTVINAKNKTKSSQKWLKRQLNNPFTNLAKIEGYLARSAYKLLEIQHKYKVFTKNIKTIIDLGCAPGSWSQVILTNKDLQNKYVVGVDILPIKFQHPNLYFIQGNFEEKKIQKEIIDTLKNINNLYAVDKKKQSENGKNVKRQKNITADCIICDIAMNAVGDSMIDRICSERIVETALLFCKKYLSKNGNFVCKTIKGADMSVINEMKNVFSTVHRFKPKSSHQNSSELFLIGLKKK